MIGKMEEEKEDAGHVPGTDSDMSVCFHLHPLPRAKKKRKTVERGHQEQLYSGARTAGLQGHLHQSFHNIQKGGDDMMAPSPSPRPPRT